ncbi:HET-domain-containing protein [Pleomassaria siparia CBS 279.74]|uniref:HET-domain-containing protein n=1 Tax=Pleomassaria siparia CBS 279.74 TaxID=1314801 RepID=A0A6G1KMC5_9PLEO|nr:HET-domain-containing protein [Pleomassaria siparia CBS 279.74]
MSNPVASRRSTAQMLSTSDGEQPSTHKRRKITASKHSLLCHQCQLLKLDREFDQALKHYASTRDGTFTQSQHLRRDTPNGPLYYKDCFFVHKFKDRLSTPSECPLCTFFRSMRVQADQHKSYKLLAFCSSESSVFCRPKLVDCKIWDEISHSVFMAVVPDLSSIPSLGHEENWLERDIPAVGSIYRLRPGESHVANTLLNVRELQEKTEFDILRGWLAFCNSHHDIICKRSTQYGTVERGFRVINCHKDQPVVEAKPWGTTYAALSYVWGSHYGEDWPNTVRDAVIVTKELGLQYLWVDRLCINQGNKDEKDYLISKMTLIYSEAEFTIVAAAGDDPSHGIPGVNLTPRRPQPKFELESGSVLVSTLRDPRLEIEDSQWSTRGWTYQEGILSNRRLVFTEYQAYWECRCMAIHDSISLPLEMCHEPGGRRMEDFMLGGIFKSASYSAGLDEDGGGVIIGDDTSRLDYGFPIHGLNSIRGYYRGLGEHIRAFSKRTLRFDSDSLTAFLGILGLYNNGHYKMKTLIGVPLWLGLIAEGRSGAQITFALSLCSWYHRTDGSLHMFVSESCTRRTHLPSWTWAGWSGVVSWRAPPQDEYSFIMCNLIEIDELDLLWAADLHLRNTKSLTSIRLRSLLSVGDVPTACCDILEVKNPLILKYFRCNPTKKEWTWTRRAGRRGRETYSAGSMAWDAQWWRIAGRLVSIGVSARMTRAEWTEKHFSHELISVLLFAGRDPSIVHGRAKFLTLRRRMGEGIDDGEGKWERVGTVQLTISAQELVKYKGMGEEWVLNLPVEKSDVDFVIY